jgi:hypothetical protein
VFGLLHSQVLDLDPSNVKALYRRAQARVGLNELLEAELDVKAEQRRPVGTTAQTQVR